MASILIIESHPILREALRQFLFPEHRATVREGWSVPADLENHDLAIVDRETLEDGGGSTDELLRALQRLEIPSVWLHQGPSPSLKPGRLTASVAKPLEGPVLEAAMRSLLSASGARSGAPPPVDESTGHEPSGAAPPGGDVIELTEVVDESGSDEPDEEM